MREDLKYKELAKRLGWKERETQPGFSNSFYRDGGAHNVYIWEVKDGWMCADLIHNHFRNHRAYPQGLQFALEKESMSK